MVRISELNVIRLLGTRSDVLSSKVLEKEEVLDRPVLVGVWYDGVYPYLANGHLNVFMYLVVECVYAWVGSESYWRTSDLAELDIQKSSAWSETRAHRTDYDVSPLKLSTYKKRWINFFMLFVSDWRPCLWICSTKMSELESLFQVPWD